MKYTNEELDKFYLEEGIENFKYCSNCKEDVPVIECQELVDEFLFEGQSEFVNISKCSQCNYSIEISACYK